MNWKRVATTIGIGALYAVALIGYALTALSAHSQTAPYVNLAGQLTGPNGLPVSNNVVTFQPTQLFYVGGTNTTQNVYNLYGNGAPVSPCAISGQLYTNLTPVPHTVYECFYGTWQEIFGGAGTVTSVGLALPSSVFSVSGSPVTGAGTLTGSFVAQPAGYVFAGPATGSPATPAFRPLVASDIPGVRTIVPGTNVTCSPEVSGSCTGDVTVNATGALMPTIIPPITGQYVFVPATSHTIIDNAGSITINNTSATLSLPTGTSFEIDDTVQWSGFTLPSYVLPANVTAVYAVAVSSQTNFYGPSLGSPGYAMTTALNCNTAFDLRGSASGWPLQQVTTVTTITGTTISSAVCNAHIGANYSGGGNMVIPQIGFLVYYTGTAPPATNSIYVNQPLGYNADTSTLYISLPNDVAADTGTVNAYAVSMPAYNFAPGLSIKMLVGHNSTSTTPTLAFNGSYAFTIEGKTGGALSSGDMVTTIPATLLWTGSAWLLQNAQVSGGGMVYPGTGIPNSTGSAWGTSYGAQGTDGNVMTAGTISGTGATVCTDANGGATTVGCSSGSITGSGTTGYFACWTGSTALGNCFADYGATLAGWITLSKPTQVNDPADPSQISIPYNSGHAPTGTALAANYAADSSGNAEVNENNGGYARICTASNSVCATSSGLSGMTAGQVPIAATATTVTSSEALAGAGAGITTGPVSSTTANDVVTMNGSNGQVKDSGTLISSLAPLASPTFTGVPAAPTASGGTSTTQLATTAFVQAAIAAAGTGAGIVTYSGPSLTFSGTQYFPIGGGATASTTETNVDIDSPAAVTIQNMTVQMSAAPGVGNSVVYTWRKNASSTSLTCTISGASATSCSDTTHSFTTISLDLLSIQAVTTGTVVGTPTVVMAAQVGIGTTGSVASFSGDGALLNNSASTGPVTATLANAAANTVWGNQTGGSTTPSYGKVALASHATQTADTVVMNATGGSAAPTAVAMPTCTTGADLYNTTTHAWSCVSTGGTSSNPWVVDEMLESSQFGAVVPFGPFGFISNATGTGASTGPAVGIAGSISSGHQGIWNINTGTASNSFSVISTGATSSVGNSLTVSSSGGILKIAAEVYVTSQSTTQETFGFGDRNDSPNPTNEISFRVDPTDNSGSTHWYAYNSNGSTNVDTGVTANAAWHQLEIVINNLSITWYVDNVSVATGTAAASNMGIFLAGWSHSSGSNGILYVDWVASPSTALTATLQ